MTTAHTVGATAAPPPGAPGTTAAGFDHVRPWTPRVLAGVLDAVGGDTWSLLAALVRDPGYVPAHRLWAAATEIVPVMEALWMRRAVQHTPVSPLRRHLPPVFAVLATGTSLPRHLAPSAGAWCLARLATYAHHLHHPGADPRALAQADRAWSIVTMIDDSHHTTAGLAGHEPPSHVTDTITDLATTHLAGRDVIQLGAGTGTVAALIAAHARRLIIAEPSPAARKALATHLADTVDVHAADPMRLAGIPDHNADAVLDHGALAVTDSPTIAITEAARVLRPGGLLIGVLAHQRRPQPLTRLHTAFRTELHRRGHQRQRFVDPGHRHHIDWLTSHGIPTRVTTAATWTETRTLDQYTDTWLDTSDPYLPTIPTTTRTAALTGVWPRLGLPRHHRCTTVHTVTATTTALGGAIDRRTRSPAAVLTHRD
ncbi:class I SAM-dependent methyltransferase [Nocardia sp. alder85J]|uniref:class I SAM-dependent methyltransferase n=1 Tax=Nocardia sp. alder85J TaxID=2862949 RepID=UPI001CD4C663|nr:class I SAM-dependent methyltransferase [Nocardia sp. alder85J]MCX4097734.1 class I SAM-dependent methyltransferase [Nocardia sp. alder85J]